uniref:Transmembrane protein n=1 Tax=Globodera pallida TaxID=36090 RepID=A0A183BPI5_GLOPA
MASRLPLCVLIVLCVSQLANGAQSAIELNGLDALAIQKQRGAQFGKDVETAVSLHLMDGTGEPITEEPGTGSTETTLGSDPSAIPTSEQPPETTKAPTTDNPMEMTPLNIALVALCGIVLLVDIILA